MTESTDVGSIAAYLVMHREDWTEGVNATESDANRLGRLSPNIRIQTNAGDIIAQLSLVNAAEKRVGDGAAQAKPFVVNLWAALAAVAPAAVPIAAVAGGALLGLLPVLATVGLGVKGISNEFKSGALDGTQYGSDINSLKDELANLQSIAAGGILDGVDKGLAASQGLFPTLNSDIGTMSNQLGDIVAGAGPALLQILNDLNPLFVTFGNAVSAGADKLESWSQHSNGITQFVSYVQAELPEVEQLVGGLAVLIGHLLSASSGTGSALLSDLNGLVHALDAIPVGVLETAIPLAISLYAALKVSAGVTAAVDGTSNAVKRLGNFLGLTGPKAVAASAQIKSSALASQAASAEEASSIAASKARESAAAAEAATEMAAAAERAGAADVGLTELIALNAIDQAASFQAVADAAATSAAEIATSAQAAADATVVAGEEASVGWSAMLGPLAAVGIGVVLLSSLLGGNDKAAQDASQAMDSYAQSVKKSTDALNEANVQQTNDNLGKQKALTTLDELHSKNAATAVSYTDLGTAINGTNTQYDAVIANLAKVAKSGDYGGKQQVDALRLIGTLSTLRTGLQAQIKTQTDLNKLNEQSTHTTDTQATSDAKLFGLVGTTGVAAYLAAKKAADDNAASTRAQTLAWQLANDAGSLLGQTLDKLSGKKISYAQADNAFQQQLVTLATNLKAGKKGLDGLGSSAISNRADLLQLITGAEQTSEAYGEMTGSSEAARQKLISLRTQIIDNAVAHGENRKAVTDYIDSILKIPAKVPPTKLDVDKAAADAAIKSLNAQILAIRQGQVPGIDLNTDAAQAKIAQLEILLNAFKGHASTAAQVSVATSGGPGGHHATGGDIYGAGSGTSDSIPAMLSNGEFVEPASATKKNHAALEAARHGATLAVAHFATGGDVVTDDSPAKKGSSKSSAGTYEFAGKKYSSQNAEDNAQLAAHKALLSAASKLDSAAGSSKSTAAQVASATAALYAAAKADGLSSKSLASIAKDNKTLNADASARDRLAAQLGTAPTAPTAYDKLAAARQQYSSDQAQYAAAGAGTFDVTSAGQSVAGPTTKTTKVAGGTVTTTTPGSGATVSSAASIIAADAADVAQLQAFNTVLHTLVREGLDKDDVAALAAKGPGALDQARALAKSTPAQIKKLSSLDALRKGTSNSLGTFLAQQFDGAGVSAAQGLVNGLLSQEKTVTAAMDRLGDALLKEIRKKLKIKSPSLVLHELGGHVGQGFANGMDSKQGAVRGAASRMADGAIPGFGGTPSSSSTSQRGGSTINQHIYPQPGQSEVEIGKSAGAEIAWALSR